MIAITKVQDGRRIVCERSYLDWWQLESPSFFDLITKLSFEMGSPYAVTKSLPNQLDIQELCMSVHGVNVIFKWEKVNSLEYLIKTELFCKNIKHDWVTASRSQDLYIPYIGSLIENIRSVWYENYRAEVGLS